VSPCCHCTAETRDDGRGGNHNARLFAGVKKSPVRLSPGSPAVQVPDEIGVDPRDLVLPRYHGLGPMTGTQLDSILRNLGATTIVGVGVSVNVGMTNLALDAVNRGYQTVLPRDAIAGFPADYADAVIDNTLSLIATISTTDDVLRAWASEAGVAENPACSLAAYGAADPPHHLRRRSRHRAAQRVAGPVAGEVQGGGAAHRAPQGQDMKFVGGVFSYDTAADNEDGLWCDWWLVEDLQYPLTRLSAAGRLPARRDHGQPDHDGRHAQGLLGPKGAARGHGREPRRGVARVPELPPLLRADVHRAQGQSAR